MNTIKPITDAPLIYDISYYQGEFKFGKLPLGKQRPVAFYLNAGIGLVKDVQFARNWQKCKDLGYYRQSYWAYHPDYSYFTQIDKWYEQNPLIDMLPRIMDLEREKGVEPKLIADYSMAMSDIIFARDGYRPWIYGRKLWLDRVIFPYWSKDFINSHYYILAEYNNYRNKEEEGIDIPDKVDPSRVLEKQTADEIPPDPLGLCPGFLDRNRWLQGDTQDMESFLISTYSTQPPVDPYDCDALLDRIEDNTADIDGLHKSDKSLLFLIENNASEIEGLLQETKSNSQSIGDLNLAVTAVLAELKEDLSFQAQEIEDNRAHNLKQLEFVDLAITKMKEGFEFVIKEEVERLDKRIDGLAGGHSHPNWMYTLGLIKRED